MIFDESDLDLAFSDMSVTAVTDAGEVKGRFKEKQKIIQDNNVETYVPAFIGKTSSVEGLKNGEWITVAGIDYRIIGKDKRDNGFTTLILSQD